MPPDPDHILAFTSEVIARKSYGHADTVLRAFLNDAGPRPDTFTMLAHLAFSVGEHSTAQRFLNAALKLDSSFAPARQGLKRIGPARLTLDQSYTPKDRFLLIRAWGQGFWSDISHVLGGIMLARHTNRTPIVWWGQDSRYTTPVTLNSWEHFFEPVSEGTLDAVTSARSYWPPKWSKDNLGGGAVNLWKGPGSRTSMFDLVNRSERVVVADFHLAPTTVHFYLRAEDPLAGLTVKEAQRRILRDSLRPALRIREQLATLRDRHGEPVAAMHLRWTDKTIEDPSLRELHARAEPWARAILARHPGRRILLLTDSASIAQDFQQRLGDSIILCDVQRSQTDQVGTHFQNFDGLKLGEDILLESLYALDATELLGSINSNVTNMIYLLKDWPEGSTSFTGIDPDTIINHAIFNPANMPLDRFVQR